MAISRKYHLPHLPVFFGQRFDLSSSRSTSILMAAWLLPGLGSYLSIALRCNGLILGSDGSKMLSLSYYLSNLRQIISCFWSWLLTWTNMRMKLPPCVIVLHNWYRPSHPSGSSTWPHADLRPPSRACPWGQPLTQPLQASWGKKQAKSRLN